MKLGRRTQLEEEERYLFAGPPAPRWLLCRASTTVRWHVSPTFGGGGKIFSRRTARLRLFLCRALTTVRWHASPTFGGGGKYYLPSVIFLLKRHGWVLFHQGPAERFLSVPVKSLSPTVLSQRTNLPAPPHPSAPARRTQSGENAPGCSLL